MSNSEKNIAGPFSSVLVRVPQRLRKKLRSAPKAGEGVHQWLFTMSLRLHRFLTSDEIEDVLAMAVQGCGRELGANEISDAVSDSLAVAGGGRRERGNGAGPPGAQARVAVKRPGWPSVDHKRRSEIIASSAFTFAALKKASPMEIDPEENVNLYLHELYKPEDLLCIGKSMRDFRTLLCNSLLDMDFADICLIVPSPMSEKYGRTLKGRRSQHSLSNTGPRRYLVTEFDFGTLDEQAAVIGHLKSSMPLVMVLHSGGKSLHAWWSCAGRTEEQLRVFFNDAVAIGADRATWSPAQFVRLPQGFRRDKNVGQSVHYFDPSCLPFSNIETDT